MRADREAFTAPRKVGQPFVNGDDVRRAFELPDAAYLEAELPVIRDTGTFEVKFANTTWKLQDVSFETPASNRRPRYSIRNRDRTSSETKE